MTRRLAPLALLLAVACRQQVLVDTSEARFIPRDVALDGLKEVLPTADGLERTQPRHWLAREDIAEWVVDDLGIEARSAAKPPIRIAFKDVITTRLDKVALHYQLCVFTPAQPHPAKAYAHLMWTSEASARRALELFDALRLKP